MGLPGRLILDKEDDTVRGNGKIIARGHVNTGFSSKPFATLAVNGWSKLPEKVVEVGPERDFKGRLDNVCLAAFLEDKVFMWG